MNSQDKGSDKFIDSMTTYLGIGTQMFSQPWLLNPTIVRLTSYHKVMTENAAYMTSFSNELINNKMKEYRERTKDPFPTKEHSDSFNKRDQPLLIDSIIEMIGNNECFFSKKEIIGEINNIIMAGMDTTANSLSLTMMLLGFHQDVQRKVQEELDAVFGDDVERSVSMEDLNNLKYTEQVIKESLRLYPAVPFVPRNTTEDIKITNYTIPKGCDVLFGIYSLHRNPNIYPNPDEFDPENFSPERSKGRHPYSFIPFSGGFRKCVGYKYAMLQMKIVLATVLRHFTVHPACDIKEMDRWDFNFTLKLVNGSKVKLISRNMVKGNK
uniref:Cytochrome P450 n=1 Tax=Timema douglasi TaxID=61478 RepID=A0A7R8VKI6_TIMDO|nr:unnamed protein product [Timema douglasi]